MTLRAAAASVDITPDRPLALGGYDRRDRLFERVADPLEAGLLLLEGDAARVLLVTADLLYPGRLLRERLLSLLGLADEELFLAASHTHSAPMTAPGLPRLGVTDPGYVEEIAARIAAAARDLKGAPAQAALSLTLADHAINRRLNWLRLTRRGFTYEAGLGPNPKGEKDERLWALRIAGTDGKPRALLWNYACHPTAFPGRLAVSADYPGVVRTALRARFGDVPVLFLQGFSGDTRPPFRGTTPNLRGIAMRLALGPQFRNPDLAEWRAWAAGLAARAVTAFETAAPIALDGPRTSRRMAAEDTLGSGGDGTKPLTWHMVDCGGLRILGANAEPVTAYRRRLEHRFGDKPLMTAGCLDQTHGYLPVDRMLPEGGYEVEGFRPLFDYKTRFAVGVEDAALAPLTGL